MSQEKYGLEAKMEKPTIVNIKNINKGRLLIALWKRAIEFCPIPFHLTTITFDLKQAEAAVQRGHRVNYFKGVAIKTDLKPDVVDPWLYDRDTYPGCFQEVVDSLRIQ